jgi:hypothetical protein
MSMISMTGTKQTQESYTIRCLLSTNHNTHKLLTTFNVLPYLISLSLATCEGTTVLYTNWRWTSFSVISRCVFCWRWIIVGFQFHNSAPLFPVALNKRPCGCSVCISIHYGLGGSRIESRWGEVSALFKTGAMVHPAFYTMGTEAFPGVNRNGRGVDQ